MLADPGTIHCWSASLHSPPHPQMPRGLNANSQHKRSPWRFSLAGEGLGEHDILFSTACWKKMVLLLGNFQMLFRKMSVKELLLLPTVPSIAFEAFFHFKQLRYQDQGSSTSLQCLLEAVKNQPNSKSQGNTSDSYQESLFYSKTGCVYF